MDARAVAVTDAVGNSTGGESVHDALAAMLWSGLLLPLQTLEQPGHYAAVSGRRGAEVPPPETSGTVFPRPWQAPGKHRVV